LTTMPAPTRDLAQGLDDIREYGLAIIPDVLTGDELKRARDALYRVAQSDRSRGRELEDFALDYGQKDLNQRIWNLLSRDPIFEDMVEHSIALEYLRNVLGWPALLGNFSANITCPGSREMMLHPDQLFLPEPWPTQGPQGMNVAWAIDDFTASNGGTRCVPGSHKLNRAPVGEEFQSQTVTMEAPAGSIVVFESRLWHKTGANTTASETRAAAFAWYTKTYVRQQENWFLSLRPEVKQFATDNMLTLLGYKTKGFGMVNGVSPA